MKPVAKQKQAHALYTGMLQAHGRIIITMDSEGLNDPADMLGLLWFRKRCFTVHGGEDTITEALS